jgi:hypothetical protein
MWSIKKEGKANVPGSMRSNILLNDFYVTTRYVNIYVSNINY